MKNLADLKRRIQPGAQLVCVDHWKREYVGQVRTIIKAQGNGYSFRQGQDAICWSYYDKAKCFTFPDADTYHFENYGKGWTLRFVEGDAQ